MELKELENKYIELILKRCINFNQSKSLMINCDFKEHIPFAEKMKQMANRMGIFDVCIHVNDLDEIHEYLKNTKVEDIKLNPLIDRTDWDIYAIKGAPIVFLNSVVPGLMDDIEEEKISKWVEERSKTTSYYRANVSKYTFPWTLLDLPNERWAKTIFKDDENAYEKLFLCMMKMCMVDRPDPVAAWDNYIRENNYYKNRLNELGIKTMHYKNSKGTDLTVTIPENNIWLNLDKNDAKGGQMIANMPSYEIFTTPDYRKTQGVVYSSKPFYYNDCLISNVRLEFKDGKIISATADVGEELLNQFIFNNKNACYLGEVALVPFNSPISNLGLVFNETLYDENSRCHIAPGHGFSKCFKDSQNLTDEELAARGLNISDVHEDIMIGTSDLEIEADTKEGKVLIFKNGNFNI